MLVWEVCDDKCEVVVLDVYVDMILVYVTKCFGVVGGGEVCMVKLVGGVKMVERVGVLYVFFMFDYCCVK